MKIHVILQNEPVQKLKKMGGFMARGKSRKKKMKLSECLTEILSLDVSGDEHINFLKDFGVAENRTDNKTLIMARLCEKAKSGDISAIKEVRAIMSENENQDLGVIADIIEAVKNVD